MTEIAYAGAGGSCLYGRGLAAQPGSWRHALVAARRSTADLLAGRPITSSGYVNGVFDVKAAATPAELAQSADLIYAAVRPTPRRRSSPRSCPISRTGTPS